MFTLFSILIILVSLIIILIVIVQNPKGSGMAGGFTGAASNVIGVQRAGDVLEKGTWGSAIVLLALCILSVAALPNLNSNSNKTNKTQTEEAAKTAPTTTPTTTPTTPPSNAPTAPSPLNAPAQ